MDDFKNRRSLREVLPGKNHNDETVLRSDIKPMFTVPEPAPIINKTPRGNTSFPVKTIVIGLVALFLIIASVLVSTVFAKATITVTPQQANIVLDGSSTITAKANPTEEGDLIFGTITKEFTESMVLPATGEKEISEKSTGTIIIYNNIDSNPFKLIANTRFETTDGKVYRIKDAISVPGMKGSNPGSIEAVVTADQPGADYNIGLSDFKLPGLKSDPSTYNKIYARSKTPMSGGFVGLTKNISESDRISAETQLKEKLNAKLTSNVSLDVPADQVLIPNSTLTNFGDLKIETTQNPNEAKVSMSMSYTGSLIKRVDLAKHLAQKYVKEYKNEPVDIQDLEKFTFVTTNNPDLLTPGSNEINFALKGSGKLVWTFDEEELKNSIKGLSKSTYSEKIGAFPAIQKTSISFRPFWLFKIPTDSTKISIVSNLE